jgi:hypothetical protein
LNIEIFSMASVGLAEVATGASVLVGVEVREGVKMEQPASRLITRLKAMNCETDLILISITLHS